MFCKYLVTQTFHWWHLYGVPLCKGNITSRLEDYQLWFNIVIHCEVNIENCDTQKLEKPVVPFGYPMFIPSSRKMSWPIGCVCTKQQSLTFNTLWAISANAKLMTFFSYFPSCIHVTQLPCNIINLSLSLSLSLYLSYVSEESLSLPLSLICFRREKGNILTLIPIWTLFAVCNIG